MNPRNQSFLVTFLFIVALAAMVITLVRNDAGEPQPLTINELAQDIELGEVSRVVIENDGTLFPGDRVAAEGAYQIYLTIKNQAGGAVDPHAGHNH